MRDFLSPQSIAVIGASRDNKKLGAAIVKNLIDHGYQGRLYPVNSKAHRILHLKCYPSIDKIEDEIDLAIIVIPATFVSSILAQCGEKKVKNIVIISAGFKETGEVGKRLENQILQLQKKYQFNVLGPNCLGFINSIKNINATFAGNKPIKGNVAFMSQSGALATSVLDLAEKVNLGFSYFVSLGNKAHLNELNFLTKWAEDEKLKSIFAYLEDIKQGQKFLIEARTVAMQKPVIVLMPGKSNEAKKAISSHTGSLAGDYQSITTGFAQNGIIHAESVEQFFDLMIVFNNFPVSFGKRLAIITNAGGPAVMATEQLVSSGLQLADFSPSTKSKLKEALPSTINIRDPLDVVGDALSDRYEAALSQLINDDQVDSILAILTPQFMTEIEKTAKVIVKYAKLKKKLILTSFLGGQNVETGISILEKNKVAHFRYPNQAIEVLSKLVNYQSWKAQVSRQRRSNQNFGSLSSHQKLLGSEIVAGKQNEFLTDKESFMLANLYDIPVTKYLLTKSEAALSAIPEFMHFPLVAKVSSTKMVHKTDFGGIILEIENEEQLNSSYQTLMKQARKVVNSECIEGIIVQEMLRDKGLEVIVGIKRDPNFGPLMMFGSGGIYTETYKDVSFRLLPINYEEFARLVSETKLGKILSGVRGKKYNMELVYDVLQKVQQLIIDQPTIIELDINPLFVGEDWVKAVDVKVKIR